MSKFKKAVTFITLMVGALGAFKAAKKVQEAYQLKLENCTNKTLDLYIGTQKAPDALVVTALKPNEKRMIDLTHLPMTEHDVVYIRFPGKDGADSYQRTLIYDIDECNYAMHGMIVDYGNGNLDVKLVKLS